MKPSLYFASMLLGLSAISYAQITSSTNILQYASDSKLFSEGLAAVQLGAQWELETNKQTTFKEQNSSNPFGKWGYMDKSGHLTIGVRFDAANDFSNGLAPVKLQNKWGLIDKAGKFVLEPKYDALQAFSDGFISIVTTQERRLQLGYLDKTGKTVVEPKYDGIKILDKNIFAVRGNNMWGVMTNDGKWIIQPLLSSIESFNNDRAIIGIKKFDSIKYGVIDKNGTILIQPSYDRLLSSKDGVFIFRNGRNFGVINEKGEIVVEPKPQMIRIFKNGLAAFFDGQKWGFIDRKGHVVVEPKYDSVGDFNDNRAFVGLKTGLFHTMHYGYINSQGEEVTELKYDRVTNFNEGLAGVCDIDFGHPHCGYIDEKNNMIIKDDFSFVESFDNGLARVTTSTYLPIIISPKYINKKGEVVLDTNETIKGSSWQLNPIMAHFVLDSKLSVNKLSSEGISSFRKEGKIGLIDQSGKIIVEPIYKSISLFKDGLARAVSMDGKVFYIDTKGKIIVQ